MKRQQQIKILCEAAMMVALATVLSMVKVWEAPLGGSVTLFSMVPILICSIVHGVKMGLFSAFAYSLLQLLLGIGTVAYVPDPLGIVLCILLDYILAFTVLGIAGILTGRRLFKNEKLNLYVGVTLGSLLAVILRFVCHLLSGAVVWYSITKEGGWNDAVFRYGKWAYSFVYNASFMLPEIILTMIAVPLIVLLVRMIWGKVIKKRMQ